MELNRDMSVIVCIDILLYTASFILLKLRPEILHLIGSTPNCNILFNSSCIKMDSKECRDNSNSALSFVAENLSESKLSLIIVITVTLSHYKLVLWMYNVDKGVIAHETINLKYNLKMHFIFWHKSYCFDLEQNRVEYNLGTLL